MQLDVSIDPTFKVHTYETHRRTDGQGQCLKVTAT